MDKECDDNVTALPAEPRHYLKGSSSGSELQNFPSNDCQYEFQRRTLTEIRFRPTHPLPIIVSSQHKKGTGQHSNTFTAVCKEVVSLLRTMLTDKNVFTDGEQKFSQGLMKSMQKMEKILDNKSIFISVFGQHNCGKSTFLNSLLGEEFLPTSAVNETSIRVTIQHDSKVHPGYCQGEKCGGDKNEGLTCPKLIMNPGTEVVGSRNIRHKLRNINEAIRKADETIHPSMTNLTLSVSLPLLTYNVPSGWTVTLVDTPGFGEANELVQQLAEDSVEVSAAYIYLLQTESIGGVEVCQMFSSIASKDPDVFIDGRLIVAITKFDTNYDDKSLGYESGSDSDISECNFSHFKVNFVKVEEKAIESLHDCIQDAAQLMVSPDLILPVCGQWALCGSKLSSYLSSHFGQKGDSDSHYARRFKAAAEALSKHPRRMDLCIPDAQGQDELEAIKQLEPSVVVQHLEEVTGSKRLKEKIQCMVGKCIKLWSLKVKREYKHYISEAKRKLGEKIMELANTAEAMKSEKKISEAKHRDIISLYKQVRKSAAMNEDAELWSKIAQNYDKDESRVSEEGKQLVSRMVEEFKSYCLQQLQSHAMPFGEMQFTHGISQLLMDTGRELNAKFDRISFRNVFDSIVDDVNQLARKCGELDQKAKQLCNDLHISIEEFSIPLPPAMMTRSPSGIPVLGDIRLKTTIPPVKLSVWTRITRLIRSILRIEKDEGCSYRSWNDDLEKVLRETESLMKHKCESYFDEIKHDTVEHFCKVATEKVDADLIPYERRYKPLIEMGIEQMKICLEDINDKQENLTYKVKNLSDLQRRLEESFDEEFGHYV